MSLISSPIPNPPTLYAANQVRQVLAAGVIQFVDGSEQLFNVSGGVTVVPTASGNVTPNPGDWILNQRAALNTSVGGPSNKSFSTLVGIPQAPNPFGPFTVVSNAVYNSIYQVSYAGSAGPNQIVQ